jgi:uncharacterized membrane protein YhaH (DUF805 family)
MNFALGTLLFSFEGRINRATYWTRAFPALLAGGLIVVATQALEFRVFGTSGVLSIALSLAGLWPAFAVTIKRLHDRGRSAWFLLTFLIPVLGPIWLLVEVWALPGTRGANNFGAEPRDPGLEARRVVPFEIVGVAAMIWLLSWTFLWPGAEMARALKANGYELLRLEEPVSGPVPLPAGNSLLLMQVDGSATIDDVEISQCVGMALGRTEAQACQMDPSAFDTRDRITIFVGSPFGGGTPAFSVETVAGRVIVVLSVDYLGTDPPNADVEWIIDEINRPLWR